jgi:molybdopterin converting factor small subunit
MITVEFYGIPRRRAGRAALTVAAGTAADALAAVERACPQLRGLVGPDGRLDPHFLLSRNGQEFLTELDRPLCPDDRLLLLSADAGG